MMNPSYRKMIHWLVVLSVIVSALSMSTPARAASTLIVNVTSPTAASPAYTKGSLNVSFTVDQSGAGQYQITVGTHAFADVPITFTADETVTATVDLSGLGLTDAAYDVQVAAILDSETTPWATDGEMGAVVVDNTAPVPGSGTLTAPNGGEAIEDGTSYTVTWDKTKITETNLTGSTVDIELRNAVLDATTTIATDLPIADQSYSWTVAALPDENYTLCLIVTDPAGNTGEDCSNAVFTIYAIDHDAPTVSITSPVDGTDSDPTYVNGTIHATATASSASGISIVAFYLSTDKGDNWSYVGATHTTGTTWTSEDIVTTTYDDGTHLWLYAVAVNGLGNSTITGTLTNVVVGNTLPTVEIDTPIDGAALGSSGVLLQARASDPHSTIESVVFSYYKAPSWTTIGTASYDAVEDLYYISSWTPVLGATIIKATATNAAALSFSDQNVITVEKTAPTVVSGELLTAPDGGELLKIGNTFTITWDSTKVSDAGGNLGTNPVSLELRNSVLGTRDVIASGLLLTSGSYAWTVAGIPDKNNKICVVMTDIAGNTGEDCSAAVFTIWGVDYEAPILSLSTVPTYNKTGITLSATATDPESGITSVEFYTSQWDGSSWSADTLLGSATRVSSNRFTYAWAPEDGQYNVTAIAKNGVGITTSVTQAGVYFDTTAPTLSWTSLADSDTLAANVALTTTATDDVSGIAKVQWDWSTDSTNWHPIASVTDPTAGDYYSSPAWDTTALADGASYVIRVTATNNVGLSTSDTRTVTIENYTSLSLSGGWNLISLPLVPHDSDIATILADLIEEGSLIRATTFAYDTGAGALVEQNYIPGVITTDLTAVEDGQGYWVNVTKDTSFAFAGLELPAPPAAPPTYTVFPGWNLIGFKSTATTTSASTYLGPAVTALMQRPMYRYDADQGIYVVVQASDLMVPGQGYWLALSAQGTIYP